MESSFANDVLQGLSSVPKSLSSKYFYDARGSVIFQEIMAMPEYYLTGCEKQIIETNAAEIAAQYGADGLQVLELGAGDGLKTTILLKAFTEAGFDIVYSPIDISDEALKQLDERIKTSLPGLKTDPHAGDYFKILEELGEEEHKTPRLILFLGSNIGNFKYADARSFLLQLLKVMNAGDKCMIGIDLKKSPDIILPAYSDKAGITAGFNLNLLDRINRELGGQFKRENFKHSAHYNEENGEVRSYLVSQLQQQVYIEQLNRSFHFAADEHIHTEISKKYSPEELEMLISSCGFKLLKAYYDDKRYFTDIIIEK